MDYIPSKYQERIFNHVGNSDKNLVVNATAGSGKTTTILDSLNFLLDIEEKSILFLAFNKSIAEELQKRLPKSVKASTIHSAGFSILRKNNPKAKMNADKIRGIIEDLQSNWDIPSEKIQFFNRIEKLVELSRHSWFDGFELKDITNLAELYDVEIENEEDKLAFEVFEKSVKDTKTFDFTDMVFMPIYHNYDFHKYDIVFCDEVQDLSATERKVFLNLVSSTGKFVAVGDKNQSIFGFKGADTNSFNILTQTKNTEVLPLSISYRCPIVVTKHANFIVPEMEYRPNAPQGELVLDGSIKNVKLGDTVLCRINAPLVVLALELVSKGTAVSILGKDIGYNLIAFIKDLKTYIPSEAINKMNKRFDSICDKARKKYPTRDVMFDSKVSTYFDKMIMAKELILKYGVQGAIDFIKKVFTDVKKENSVELSSIHSYKGKENDNIFILEPKLLPFPYYDSPMHREQERNLDFVARTRAKNKLEYIKDWSYTNARKSQ